MNGEGRRVEAVNQLVRAIITLALVAGFLWSALVLKLVSQETFNNIVLLVVTWWFARDQARAAVKESIELLKAPSPLTPPQEPGTTTTTTVTKETTP